MSRVFRLVRIMHVIKRKGHKEKFDEKKVYGSVYSACYVCDMKEKECERIAKTVSREIKSLASRNKIITSEDIFKHVARILKKHHEDAAFMYETHRDVS